jgi:microcystin degradation protein MlrC
VRVGGVEFVLNTHRTQAFGPELFSNVGIDPHARKLLVVKSDTPFRASFGPLAKKLIYVNSIGGAGRALPYTRIKRPIWPLDEESTPGLIV